MGMKEVIEGTITDTVNERLDEAKLNIIAQVDSVINRATIGSVTDSDANKRVLYTIQKRTAESVKEIVEREINKVKVTPTHPIRKNP